MKNHLKHKNVFKNRFLFSLLVMGFLCISNTPLIKAADIEESKISVHVENGTLYDVFKQIETQTEFRFLYDNSEVSNSQKITLSFDVNSLKEAMDIIAQKANLSYRISDKQIYLSKKKHEPSSAQITSAQQKDVKSISGTILDSDGVPLIGVSVLVEGTTDGTLSDTDGKYTLKATEGKILLFRYIGYDPERITVGTKTVMDLVMKENNVSLEAVVITALGIKREVKSLTYNVQEIKPGEITAVKDANLMNSLAGKVAGVTINQSASGIGGSTRVIMRGTKSLNGNNNALYVLDGIPLAELKSKQSTSFYENEDGGDNDGISSLNPDDIENISMLTGAAAAALYGNRGSNGVVLITTKKGSVGKLKVSYSNNTTFMSPFVMPKFQNTYGREGETVFDSWGAKADQPYAYKPKDFFQTGAMTTNSIGISSGSERNQTHISLGAVNSRGIIPNNTYERYNFTLRNNNILIKDVLEADASLQYSTQKDQNMYGQGMYYNPLVPLYLFPPSDDMKKFVVYEAYDEKRNFKLQNWTHGNQGLAMQNPYWIINRNMFNNARDRYILTGALKYDITSWLNATARLRYDRAESNSTRKLYASTENLYTGGESGNYMTQKGTNKNIYADFLLNADKRLSPDLRLVANFGVSIFDEKYDMLGYEGPLDLVNFFHTSNIINQSKEKTKVKEPSFHERTNSGFGTVQLGYKSLLYLDLTARADWFSTLAGTNNEVVFYPSAGLSGVVTEAIKVVPKEILSYMKIRGSYSQVGNPPPRYLTKYEYVPIDENTGTIKANSFLPANHLKAEKTKAFEIGTDMNLINDKLSIAFTYYNSNTYNQLFRYDKAPSSGFGFGWANAGKVNNWGLELTLGYDQKIGPVEWSSTLVYSLNRNKIKELLPDEFMDPSGEIIKTDESSETYIVCKTGGAYYQILKVGGTMGDIYVNTLKRDHTGAIYVDPTSGAIQGEPNALMKAGSSMPNYNLGFRNGFKYNGISLNFLIDGRVGGVVVSSTQALMDRFGTSRATADARDKGGITLNGTGTVPAKGYYQVTGGGELGVLSMYTYSATNVRLRELTLGYDIPSKIFNNKINASVSLIGRNLFMIYNKAPFDPELSPSTGTYFQGFDYFMPPSLRSIGFGLKVTL